MRCSDCNPPKREVSDGIIAPDYTPEALEVLKSKKKGNYNVVKIDPNYVPAPIEHKDVFGITFEQGRNELKIDEEMLLQNIVTDNKNFTEEAKRDLLVALIILNILSLILFATQRAVRQSV